jgi:hypothetical protein
MSRIKRFIREGEMFPKGYGIAWVEQNRYGAVVMPIPLNVIAGHIRKMWFWLQQGDWYKTGYDRGYSMGYESGRKYAFEQYKHHARKEIEEEVRTEIAEQMGFTLEAFRQQFRKEQTR